MNKKEQAFVLELKKQLALSWPRYEEPDPVPHSYLQGQGWFQHNYDTSYRVTLGCSNGISHSTSNPDKTSSQGPGVMYPTKLDALKVARCQMTDRFAAALAAIDAEIQAAMEAHNENR